MPRASKNKDYIENGVTLSPAVPSQGDKAKIIYDGWLSKNGASTIYAHVGFGEEWDNISDFEMKKTKTSFEAIIPVLKSDTLNVCFKDSAENWDNNSGLNYNFEVN